jgi:hypothetical protein
MNADNTKTNSLTVCSNVMVVTAPTGTEFVDQLPSCGGTLLVAQFV